MKTLEELKEMLEDEMKKIVKKGDISTTELDNAYKAIDVIKDIETIKAMQEADWGGTDEEYSRKRGMYSRDPYQRVNSYDVEHGQSNDASYEQSHARRGRDGDGDGRYSEDGSYARGRDARGRYTSRDGGSYEYSRHTEKERMIEKLEQMATTVSSEKERQAIMQCIEKLEG